MCRSQARLTQTGQVGMDMIAQWTSTPGRCFFLCGAVSPFRRHLTCDKRDRAEIPTWGGCQALHRYPRNPRHARAGLGPDGIGVRKKSHHWPKPSIPPMSGLKKPRYGFEVLRKRDHGSNSLFCAWRIPCFSSEQGKRSEVLMPHLAVDTAGFDDADLQPVRLSVESGRTCSGMMPPL
jgi:hypothetical protein